MTPHLSRTLIAAVAFQRVIPFHLSVPCIVFGEGITAADNPFEVRVCAGEPGPVKTSTIISTPRAIRTNGNTRFSYLQIGVPNVR